MKISNFLVAAIALALAGCATQSQQSTESGKAQMLVTDPCATGYLNHRCVPRLSVTNGVIDDIGDQHFVGANHLIFWIAAAGWKFPPNASDAIVFKTGFPGSEFTCGVGPYREVLLCYNRHTVTGAYEYRLRLTNGSTTIQTPDPMIFND